LAAELRDALAIGELGIGMTYSRRSANALVVICREGVSKVELMAY
jgi:hypothetical protein